MLNDSKWIDIGETVFELRNKDNELISTLSYNEVENMWQLENGLNDNYILIEADSSSKAKWKATVELGNYYNGIISLCMAIRDHLPSLGELYDKAFD